MFSLPGSDAGEINRLAVWRGLRWRGGGMNGSASPTTVNRDTCGEMD
jgi:hypothetical protein